MHRFALTLVAAALFGAGLVLAGLPQSCVKVAKPEFVHGQCVIIKVGSWTIEGTVEEPQEVNRAAKGDRLVRADGEPMEEYIFHTAERR